MIMNNIKGSGGILKIGEIPARKKPLLKILRKMNRF